MAITFSHCSFNFTEELCMQRIVITLILAISASGAFAADAAKQLNLLIITADDMNADSGGWNGNTLGTTPRLDAFAKSAHRFVNSHVTVPICQPGRSTLMTGRVPHRNGALGFNPIRRDVPVALQAHDPNSIVYYRNIRVKVLPE